MPNTGKPSKDCHLCRSRRVKCDLARPQCQRCIKYGVECPGYRDEQELMFRNINSATVKKRKKRAEQLQGQFVVSLKRENEDDSSGSEQGLKLPASSRFAKDDKGEPISRRYSPTATPNVRSMNEHWTTHSIPLLLNVYSTMEFMQNLYKMSPVDGPLVWAAHLFARTYTINLRNSAAIQKESYEESQRELGTYMGKALSTVSEALKTPEGAYRDDILATVWILANYELLVGSIAGEHPLISPWHLHAQGLHSILKTRGIKKLRTDVSRAAFWSAFNIVQVEALISSTEGPPEAEEWFEFIRQDMIDGEALGLACSMFITKIARIQARMLAILRNKDFEAANAEYPTLLGELTSAEATAEVDFLTIPASWDSFDTYWRNTYNAACVKAFHIAHMMVNFLTHYPLCTVSLEQLQATREYCLNKIRESAREILMFCGRILNPTKLRYNKLPQHLFDAFKLIWPLTSVYIIPSTQPEQKSQAEMALYFIGRELGIRQALHTYPGTTAGRVPVEAEAPLGFGEPENLKWVGRLREP